MRAQRIVALAEVFRALDPGGHSAGEKVMVGVPVRQPLFEWAALAVPGELILQHLHPLPQEAVDVVQLGHRPRLTRVGKPAKVTGRLVGSHRNLMAANVVGMWVAAVLVVGGHHVRPKLANHPHQRLGGHLQRYPREAVIRQRWR
ncbi:Uncharacterised protein [Mycobacterium tuberculosis]|nr:Uncharacterised protein [Mycobacterium tuberculosis]CKU79441.1 Uncharacterised protein [Mycobacterium tuberculosis]